MKLKIRILIFLSIVFLISGFIGIRYISDISALEELNVSIESVSIQELYLTNCVIRLNVNISNPTNEYISELSVEFDVAISGTYVGNGSVSTVSITANSHKTKYVPLTIYYANVGNAVIDGIQSRNFDMTIQGEVKANILFNLYKFMKPFTSYYSYS